VQTVAGWYHINTVTKKERPLAWVQVKEAMVDDAQASIANLKAQLSAAQAEAAESAQALRHAEADLTEHEAEEQRQHQSLRYITRCFTCHKCCQHFCILLLTMQRQLAL
jgi:septal ring factor EnvC (AmiA/AmiB activator)